MTSEHVYPWRRSRSFPAPAPHPPDPVSLLEIETIAADLALVAGRLGVTSDGAYDAARRLEVMKGYSTRSRALQAVATANAAIERAMDVANGAHCVESIAYRINLARTETEAARVVMVKAEV